MDEKQAIKEALAALDRMDAALSDLHSLLPFFKRDGGYGYYGQRLEGLLDEYRAYLEALQEQE